MWIFGAIVIAVSALLVRFKLPASIAGSELKRRMMLWIVLGSFAGFMMLKLSQPLGMLIPKIDIGVFTWRMLSITTLVTALLTGACAQAAIEIVKERLHWSVVSSDHSRCRCSSAGVCSARLGRTPVLAPVLCPNRALNAATLPRTAPRNPNPCLRIRLELSCV